MLQQCVKVKMKAYSMYINSTSGLKNLIPMYLFCRLSTKATLVPSLIAFLSGEFFFKCQNFMILLIWMFSMWHNLTKPTQIWNPNSKISIFLISNYQLRGNVWSNTIWNFIWTYILILKGIAEYLFILI